MVWEAILLSPTAIFESEEVNLSSSATARTTHGMEMQRRRQRYLCMLVISGKKQT